MRTNSKLMEMLTGYAAAHQHPVNVFVHMIGIPTIMLGVLIPLSWVTIQTPFVSFTLAHVAVVGLVAFYLTLDVLFALVFALAGLLLAWLAGWIAMLPFATSAAVAAVCFFGGYAAQFVGHAVEKSMPVLVRHP
ncbi:MAG: Mpo1-like protein, partial [Woeseiaceae bacterium]|nr:Mpo1-like protein [Woeseiaceae bacterium]